MTLIRIDDMYISPYTFCVFTVTLPSVTQRSISQKSVYLPFFHQTTGLDNSFTLIENKFIFLR